jgi:hypothetical protein
MCVLPRSMWHLRGRSERSHPETCRTRFRRADLDACLTPCVLHQSMARLFHWPIIDPVTGLDMVTSSIVIAVRPLSFR